MGLSLEIQTSNEWHLIKGETQYGPYSYEEVIQMMQSKMVFSFDYVWSPHLEAWTAVGELEEFSADRLARLIEKNPQAGVFNRRVSERVACRLPVFVSDQKTLWEGTVESMSEGGALVLMKNPTLLPGEVVQMHFRSGGKNDLAFNCLCEILTKKLVKNRIQHDTGIHYAVKFIASSPVGEKQVQNLIQTFKKDNK